MHSVKADLQRERDYLRPEDYRHFDKILAFSLEYLGLVSGSPGVGIDFGHVASVLNIETVGFLLKRIMENYELKVYLPLTFLPTV